VDTAKKVWEYVHERHTGEHHGKRRVIFLDPRAKAIRRP
jgi:hypothetical protein